MSAAAQGAEVGAPMIEAPASAVTTITINVGHMIDGRNTVAMDGSIIEYYGADGKPLVTPVQSLLGISAMVWAMGQAMNILVPHIQALENNGQHSPILKL